MNKAALGALSMDLKRVAMGYYRGSDRTAQRFLEEALKRKSEIVVGDLKPYLQKLLEGVEHLMDQTDKRKAAEDALMYSTLFQNAALKL